MVASFPFSQKIANVPIGTKDPFDITVNTSATLIVAANPLRSSVVMQIVTGGPVYLGGPDVSTTSYIIALSTGMVLTDDDSNDAWYGIVASGSVVVHGCEVTQ